MTAAICLKNIYILLADDVEDDVMLEVYKFTSFNIGSPLMKTGVSKRWVVNAVVVWQLHSVTKTRVAANMLGLLC